MALALDKLTHLRIPLEDVRKATDNFHKDNIISTGGFGPAYKGSLLWSGKRVKIATRRLDRRYGLGEFEFWTEVSVLSDLKYPNIVSMIGYCDEQDEKIIITEYVAKGSLERFLNRPNLTWTQRLQICIGVARALSYLHCGDGRDYVVIHRNINSYTILLDENWEPKLSGFEISVKQSVNRIDQVFLCELIGEEGYMDPDIEKTRGLTCKSDMYSFGVVLFEILCRRLALIENDANSFLAPFAKNHYEKETLKDIVHPDLWIQMSPWSLVKYSKSAYSCLEEEQAYRPDMGYIVVELNEALEFQLTRENLGKHFDHLKIPLTNILLATENFSERYSISNNGYHAFYRVEMHRFDDEFSSYVVGKDKDKVPQRHNTVIIKRLLVSNSKQREKVFNTEIQMLTSVKHPKIVTLFGFCFEATEMILVIANFSNGYLEAALQDVNKKSIMTWEKRLKICIDVAQALNYIHFELEEQKTIINHDIRCAYIMLDEKYVAKIAEFGLAVVLPPNQDDEALYHDKKSGSRYYRDPEYEQSGKLKRESDVYSFGVVMFEILFGRIASDPIYRKESGEGLAFVARRCFNMGMLEYMIDPIIKDQIGENDLILHRGPNKDSLKTFVEIAYKCIAKTQDRRPSMKIILKQLQKSLFLQEKGVQSIVMEQLVDKQGEVLELQSRETPGKHLEHLKIPLANIQLATDNFSERYSISNNGYHAFYRAEMHHFDNEFSSYVGGKDKDKVPQRHNTVIIKRLLVSNMKQREKVFNTEIQMLTSVKHPKIVTLLGFCFEATEMILVIENFSNGFLGATLQHVNEKSILTWEKRLKICIDVAQALNYIHSEREEQMTIINRDIRCDYIMLDENYVAKIAEFGLAVVLPSNQDDKALYHNVTSGTSWYKDPEYRNTGKLKRESDVYSFGVVLFEILFGRKAYDPIYLKESDEGLAFVARRYFNMGTLEDMIDPIIQGEVGDNSILDRGSNKDSLRTFIEIAYKCIARTQDERPTMKIILKQLQKALLFQGKHLDHLKIPLNNIQLATKFFSESYIIRDDGYHTWYKAEFHHFHKEFSSSVDGKSKDKVPKRHNTVFIKRTIDEGFREEEFYTEIKILTSVKHPNIVTLIGFCVEGSEINLVIENFSNGCLRDALLHANSKHTLTWDKRLKICIDVARALNYIHYETEDQKIIINRGISSWNIMLNESWEAKITDFEMSVFLPPNQKDGALDLKTISGYVSYIDPEYLETGKLKRESDVYSFGVVMLEILLGRLDNAPTYVDSDDGLAAVVKRSFDRGTLEDMIDPTLKNKIDENNFLLNRGPNKDSLRTFFEIALKCVAEMQDQRPTMKVVLNQLEKALFLQENSKDNPFIPLEDIKLATQNFHADKFIGRGGFGKVYLGKLQDGDGLKTIVAKRLDTSGGQIEQQFLACEYNWSCGYCDENGEKIIVYGYASRSSLDRYLDDARLTWKTRLNICIEVASALEFLHGGAGKQAKVVQRDIKTANILLNHNWNAKLADFGLSLISPLAQETDYIINRPCGTRGYVDPLYAESKFLTIKSDVYSFGVVLFEILCGRSTFRIYEQEGLYLPDFIKKKFEEGKHDEVVFKQIREQVMPKSLTTFQEITYQCLQHESEKRPTTTEVLMQLKKAMEFQNTEDASKGEDFKR